jgi:hypothetical protein
MGNDEFSLETAQALAQVVCERWEAGEHEAALALFSAATAGAETGAAALAVGPELIAALCAAGQRLPLIGWLEALQRERPEDTGCAHTLGLLYFWHADTLEAEGQTEAAIEAWKGTIACWSPILEHDDLCVSWCATRLKVYGAEPRDDYISAVRTGVVERLRGIWRGHADRYAAAGQAELADRYSRLELLFEVERQAVRRLLARGGLPL